MFDEVEEDEREIRRLQRGELFRRPKPKLPEQQGDVMERRETIAERLRQRAATIRAAGNDSGSVKDQNFIDGGISALEVLASDVEDGTFTWSNQHTALVEQRDRLTRMLANIIDANYGTSVHDIGNGDGLPEKEAEEIRQWMREYLRASLATVEQGGESR